MKNRIILTTTILFFLYVEVVYAQDNNKSQEQLKWYNKGVFYGKMFANFHTSLDNKNQKAFELNKAYIGYKTELNNRFLVNLKLDISKPTDIQDTKTKKRFAYFKNAYIQYKFEQFKISFGIADCYQFKVQEKFWGYRYIYKSMQDKYKFGVSSDVGLFTSYKFNNFILADASFSNGEGYGYLQSDDKFKTSIGLTITPIQLLTVRLYYDRFTILHNAQSNYTSFFGVRWKKISFASEFVFHSNSNCQKYNNKIGVSAYTTIRVMDKFKIFGRYDYLTSNKLKSDSTQWNIDNDGSAVILGLEYSPIKKVQISLNYRNWLSYKTDKLEQQFLYLSLQAIF